MGPFSSFYSHTYLSNQERKKTSIPFLKEKVYPSRFPYGALVVEYSISLSALLLEEYAKMGKGGGGDGREKRNSFRMLLVFAGSPAGSSCGWVEVEVEVWYLYFYTFYNN